MTATTDLRARRGYDGYEGRASSRTGPHRIATSACLTALESRALRRAASGLGGPSGAPGEPLRAPARVVPGPAEVLS